MTRTSSETVDQRPAPAPDAGATAEGGISATPGPVDPTLASSQAFLDGLQAANREFLDFWRDGMERLEEVRRRLAACRSPEETLSVQDEYVQAMIRAHRAMEARLPALLAEAMVPALEAAKRQKRRAAA